MSGTNGNGPPRDARERAERSPFGALHYHAVATAPATADNGQREDFLRGRPNVYDTLRRHLEALIRAGLSREQYDAIVAGLVVGADALWHGIVLETETTLAEALALDEAAEGVEDVAEIDAMADPTAGRLQSLWMKMVAAVSAKQRALKVIARDFRRATGHA